MKTHLTIVVTVMEFDRSNRMIGSSSDMRTLKDLAKGKSVLDYPQAVGMEAQISAVNCVRRMQDAKDTSKEEPDQG